MKKMLGKKIPSEVLPRNHGGAFPWLLRKLETLHQPGKYLKYFEAAISIRLKDTVPITLIVFFQLVINKCSIYLNIYSSLYAIQ